jgi:hypothetical protein
MDGLRFMTIKALTLRGVPTLRIEPDVIQLSKSSASSSSGISLFQLKELQLIGSDLRIEQPLVLPKLRRLTLQVMNDYEEWLKEMLCPNLTVLDNDNATPEEGYWDFIRRHPSITSLNSEHWQALENLFSAAPQWSISGYETLRQLPVTPTSSTLKQRFGSRYYAP